MELNLLRPMRVVEKAFYEPNVPLSLFFVMLPTIISVIGAIIFGLQLNSAIIALSVVSAIVAWIALAILFYIAGFIIEGESLKGKFSGILSSLSIVWLAFAIMAIAGLLLVATLPKEVITAANELQRENADGILAYEKMSGTLDKATEQANIFVIAAFNIIALALMAYAILIVFLIAKETSPKRLPKQAILFALFIVSAIIVSVLSSAIATFGA